MFYAKQDFQSEVQALAFDTKSQRDRFVAANPGVVPMTAQANRQLQTAGARYVVSDNDLGCVYRARIVAK